MECLESCILCYNMSSFRLTDNMVNPNPLEFMTSVGLMVGLLSDLSVVNTEMKGVLFHRQKLNLGVRNFRSKLMAVLL